MLFQCIIRHKPYVTALGYSLQMYTFIFIMISLWHFGFFINVSCPSYQGIFEKILFVERV